MAKLKYGAKKDANHSEVVKALESFGASVLDLSSMGCGVPDIIVWCRGRWNLCDIKNKKTAYGRRGLNKRQTEWAENWRGGPVYLLYNVDDAKAMVEGRINELKSVGGLLK
jgi:hypothetical protein